jgi:hypothetical protein
LRIEVRAAFAQIVGALNPQPKDPTPQFNEGITRPFHFAKAFPSFYKEEA